MYVRKIMRRDYGKADAEDGLNEAVAGIVEHGCLVVMDKGRYFGIVAPEDVALSPKTILGDCASRPPGLSPDSDIAAAIEAMVRSSRMALPVFDGESLVGVLLFQDVALALQSYSVELETAIEGHKRIERELEVVNADLQRQTALATDMAFIAEQAAGVKQQFLANMSHELRTPLNGVIAPADMLVEGLSDPGQRELAGIIVASGRNLLNLVNDILDFSKIEAGKMRVNPIPADIGEIVEESLVPVALKAKGKGVGFAVIVAANVPPRVLVDSFRVAQVLLNLVGNAVKFTDTGGRVEVTVREAERLGNRSMARFSIKDTGIGISKEQLDKLFAPFTQADGSNTRKYGGTGLGLSISKQLVELMGGDIGCDSEPGKGSEFWFVLPLEEVEGEAPKVKIATDVATTGMDFRGLRVLIVEDNPINSKVARLALRNIGVERITALDDGAKAIEAMKSERFDLVLMDCQMPVMNGYEATRAVRGGRSGVLDGNIPIIAMTANAMEGDREKCLESGMNDYIAKPVAAAKLKEVLSRWAARGAGAPLDGAESAAEATAAVDPEVWSRSELEKSIDRPDTELVMDLLSDSVEPVEKLIADLAVAVNNDGDVEAVRSLAHTLKDSAATIGARRLAAAAKDFEKTVDAG